MEELIEELVARVRATWAVRTEALLVDHAEARAARLEALSRRGLERTERHVRVPLGEQLSALITTDGEVAEKGLRKRLAGVESAEELAHAIEEASRQGTLVRAIGEGGAVVLVTPGDVIDDETATRLSEAVTAAQRRIKAARRKGLPLRRTVLARLRAVETEALEASVLAAIAAVRGPLVSIPDLVRHLNIDAPSLHAVLFALAEAGRIELRPESGAGSLGAEDAALCPRTPEGVCLSYLRPLR